MIFLSSASPKRISRPQYFDETNEPLTKARMPLHRNSWFSSLDDPIITADDATIDPYRRPDACEPVGDRINTLAVGAGIANEKERLFVAACNDSVTWARRR